MPKIGEAIEYKLLAPLGESSSLQPRYITFQLLDIILEPLLIISEEMAHRR